ncbi:unnamed protein product, partial [Phaeothamnion confervicola]
MDVAADSPTEPSPALPPPPPPNSGAADLSTPEAAAAAAASSAVAINTLMAAGPAAVGGFSGGGGSFGGGGGDGAAPSRAALGALHRRSGSGLLTQANIHSEIDAYIDDLEEELQRQRLVLHLQVEAAIDAARADERRLAALLRRAKDALAFSVRSRRESCPAELLELAPAVAARVARLTGEAHQLRHGFFGAPALLPEVDKFRLVKCAAPIAERVATVLSCADLQPPVAVAAAAAGGDAAVVEAAAAAAAAGGLGDGGFPMPATPSR